MFASPKLRITARIGILSFSEYMKKIGQPDAPQLAPEDAEVLAAPNSVAELEQKLQAFPSILDSVEDQIMRLPPEKQKEGEVFYNNLMTYYSQMQRALSDIKQIQQDMDTPSQSIDDLLAEAWEKEEQEAKKQAPQAKPEQETAPSTVAPKPPTKKKSPGKKFFEEPPTAPRKPKYVDPTPFDPNLRTLPTEEEQQKGGVPGPAQSEFAQSPENVQKQKDTEVDVNAIATPTKNLEQGVINLLDLVKKTPDLQVKRDPAKFKSDIATSINALVTGLSELKPIVDNIMENYAFEPESLA